MPARRLRFRPLLLTCLALLGPAAAEERPPLSPDELAKVIPEIQAMIRTDENRVKDFPVREATPERIDRLYRMPEITAQPRNVRENGLIFAGQGELLRFDKPSDIVSRLETWFPEEFRQARAAPDPRFFGHLHLYGPFAGWRDEPAAFLTLWNCMPQSAWLRPDTNPFARRQRDGGLPLMPIAAQSSATQEFDFGFCVANRSGLRAGWTREEARSNAAEVRQLAAQVTPVLRRHFARFLDDNGCQGTGPDDCVLVLHLWASLTPDDPELAATVRRLENEVGPDTPLPELEKPTDQYGSGGQEGEARFDAALRRAAFLRAKLRSVQAAPAAWPGDALPALVRQLTQFRQRLAEAADHRWYPYALDYYNEPVNPWGALTATEPLWQAVLAELDRLPPDTPCPVFAEWFEHSAPGLTSRYVLARVSAGRPVACAAPEWTWLQDGRTAEARTLRNRYIALSDRAEGGQREWLIAGLTGNGNDCFDPAKQKTRAWLRDFCRTRISEPQEVGPVLKHSRLRLTERERYRRTGLPPLPDRNRPAGTAQAAAEEHWLLALIPAADTAGREAMRQQAREFRNEGWRLSAATRWQHPRRASTLVDLTLFRDGGGGDERRLLLVLTPQRLQAVSVPDRFRYQYDAGALAAVSDLDHDGNLEVWLRGENGECDGAGLQPGRDCAVPSLYMGEVRGDSLSYFVKSAARKP
ncbi:hypothetical protein EV700_0971 [Fluviicoccus keumensis]|uniref:VCBS repeat protein n=1 Tax=Fluviicoccus keumensis TaxID=1435465 RepID=A0A4Q7ZBK5_9GAMM|nr:hypothetical protein [Fluviicoccus keumensis]RZU48002.1 hypothetical protein EV700_0971 [Fluviicoccus keumensis]